VGERHQDSIQTALQIVQIVGQAEDGHDFRSGGNVKSGFTRDTLQHAAQTHHDITQGAVVHVDHPFPGDAAGVDGLIGIMINFIVEEGGQKIVCGGDGVKIPREMQVDFLCG